MAGLLRDASQCHACGARDRGRGIERLPAQRSDRPAEPVRSVAQPDSTPAVTCCGHALRRITRLGFRGWPMVFLSPYAAGGSRQARATEQRNPAPQQCADPCRPGLGEAAGSLGGGLRSGGSNPGRSAGPSWPASWQARRPSGTARRTATPPPSAAQSLERHCVSRKECWPETSGRGRIASNQNSDRPRWPVGALNRYALLSSNMQMMMTSSTHPYRTPQPALHYSSSCRACAILSYGRRHSRRLLEHQGTARHLSTCGPHPSRSCPAPACRPEATVARNARSRRSSARR